MGVTHGSEAWAGQTSQGIRNQDGESECLAASLGGFGSEGGTDGVFVALGVGGGDRGGQGGTVSGGEPGGIVRQLMNDLQQQRSLRLAEVELIDQRLAALELLQESLSDGQKQSIEEGENLK
jgi:hypothetical protein